MKGVFLGKTGEDKVGRANQTTPDGNPDLVIQLTELTGSVNGVTVQATDSPDKWVAPYNGNNWIVGQVYDAAAQTLRLYLCESAASKVFNVNVTYTAGGSDSVAGVVSGTDPVPPIPVPPDPTVHQVVINCTGPVQVTVDGKPVS